MLCAAVMRRAARDRGFGLFAAAAAAATAPAAADVVDLCSSSDEEEQAAEESAAAATAAAAAAAAPARPSRQDVHTFVYITKLSTAEAETALADAGGLQAATERWFLMHKPPASSMARSSSQLRVGDYVKLTTAALVRSVSEGPLKRGGSGIVCVVEEGDEEPYQVMAGGRTWWYQAGEVSLDSSDLLRARVKKEVNNLKPTAVEDIPHDPDCYITTAEASPPNVHRASIASTPLDSPDVDGDLQVVVIDPMLFAPHASTAGSLEWPLCAAISLRIVAPPRWRP